MRRDVCSAERDTVGRASRERFGEVGWHPGVGDWNAEAGVESSEGAAFGSEGGEGGDLFVGVKD
jgi:hypothetical protein